MTESGPNREARVAVSRRSQCDPKENWLCTAYFPVPYAPGKTRSRRRRNDQDHPTVKAGNWPAEALAITAAGREALARQETSLSYGSYRAPRSRKHGDDAFWIDVESQKCQRLIAGVSPLVHKAERFIDQGTRSPRLCLAVHRVSSRSRDDVISDSSFV